MTLTNFHFNSKNAVCKSHVMMYVSELNTYVHIWDIEGEPVVKMNIAGTTKQKKITSKKQVKELINIANKMIEINKSEIEKQGFVNVDNSFIMK